jgi:hypothetical protein
MQWKALHPHFLFLIFYLIIISCTSSRPGFKNNLQKETSAQNKFAIKNVNVIPMINAGEILTDATVVIENGKIASINGPIPDHAKIINGKGKWLIPGLIDMHVHVATDVLIRPSQQGLLQFLPARKTS